MPLLRDALGWLKAGHGSALPDPMARATAWPERKASATALPERKASATALPERKASATAAILAWETPRTAVWSPRDYATFANEGFMQNPIVYRSVRMIAEAAASIPLLLYSGREEIEDHPLLDLLAQTSLDQTGTDFLEAWYGYLLVSGNAYAEAVAVDGRIREIHALRPDRMKVVPGADGWPEAFEYAAGGRSLRLAGDAVSGVRRVLHVRLFHPTNDHYGMSPIEAASLAIDTHNTAAKWNKALLDNSARPSGALVYANRDGHLTEEQFARLKAELETGFQGARHAGRPLLLEGGLDWKPLSLTPKDMDFVEAKNSAAREIALALGVPPMLLGIPGDNTYANYQEASRSLWRQTVLPLVNRTAKALAMWLAPGFGPGPLTLKPDLDQIEALSSEREALWARLEKASFLTDDEKRASIGYGPRGGLLSPAPAQAPTRGGHPKRDSADAGGHPKRDSADAGGHPKRDSADAGGHPKRDSADAGGHPKREIERAAKFNPYHDELGRFTTADGAAAGASGQDPGDEDVDGADDGSANDDDGGLQTVADRTGARQYAVDLAEHDSKYGGHAFKRHVERPDDDLMAIVSRDRATFFSYSIARIAQGSFLTKEDANNFVNGVLEENASVVAEVAVGKIETAGFMKRFGYVTGKEAFRPAANSEPYIRPTYEVYVRIDRDKRSPTGFRVFTAYPFNQLPTR